MKRSHIDLLNNSERFFLDERIKRSVDIKNLFSKGKRICIQGAKLFYMPNGLLYNRIGFPLPRGFGNAVQRNRSKRYSREAYRHLKTYLNTGFDILLLVYPESGKTSFNSRCVQFRTLCKKAGLTKE